MPTIELSISCNVQGVFFRAGTRQKATALGLTGWVKNEPDGSVRVRASGTATQLDALESWCAQGPEGARVTNIIRKSLPEESFAGFSILR